MGQKQVSKCEEFVFATSSLDRATLKPGESSRHDLDFTLLTSLELTVSFKVSCPAPEVLLYQGDKDAWEHTHIFGGLDLDLRKAGFDNVVTASATFASSGESKDQRLALQAKARSGEGPWENLASLDHPVTIGS